MTEKEERIIKLRDEIHQLRKNINDAIENKDNLLDPEILAMSKKLDSLINKYYKLHNKKIL